MPEVQLLVQGSQEFNMPDNIAYQPAAATGSSTRTADDRAQGRTNNDLWDCLDDRSDDDRCPTVHPDRHAQRPDAEWTGGFFDPTGKHFYVSIQHNSSGKGTILDITGWK